MGRAVIQRAAAERVALRAVARGAAREAMGGGDGRGHAVFSVVSGGECRFV